MLGFIPYAGTDYYHVRLPALSVSTMPAYAKALQLMPLAYIPTCYIPTSVPLQLKSLATHHSHRES